MRNGDSIDRISEVLGLPAAFSSPGRDPVLLKYGNVQITCIAGKLTGIGIDLSEDAPSEPTSLDLTEVMQLRGLSQQQAAEIFKKWGLELVEMDSTSSGLKGGPRAFLSFENDAVYRVGLRMHI